ncbi:hypothetical protein GF420_15340 [candidate division GN15 bacterium]|nr:hypothetical protein [candidate division GN15 bacterium]
MIEMHLTGQAIFPWTRSGKLTWRGAPVLARGGRAFVEDTSVSPDKLGDLLSATDGAFAIVVSDGDEIAAAVDRVRSFPLFYARGDGRLYLSDDPLWVAECRGAMEIDDLARIELQVAGFVTGAHTLMASVRQLQAGEKLHYDDHTGRLTVSRYFAFRHSETDDRTDDDWCDAVDEMHRQVLGRLVEGLDGRPVALPLSGGYDSRVVAWMLKRLGYDNVFCFTYGKRNNWESRVSRQVADQLGFRWVNLPDSYYAWRRFFGTDERARYYQFAGRIVSLPHMQDYLAVRQLREDKLISEDAVFVPGHSGDFVAGSHIPAAFDRDTITRRDLLDQVYREHFWLWARPLSELQDLFDDRIGSQLDDRDGFDRHAAADAYEYWDWQERQAKFICNSVRVYEFLGYEWRLPMWDELFMGLWQRVPFDKRLGRRLFFKYVRTREGLPLSETAGQNASVSAPDHNRSGVRRLAESSNTLRAIRQLLHYFRFYRADRGCFHPLVHMWKAHEGANHVNGMFAERYVDETIKRVNNGR